jgi:inorganic pyrophosphatase
MTFPKPFYKWRPHPWHGLEIGPNPPEVVHVFVEMTPFDTVKYEVDKETGFLRVDRPQRTSSIPPNLYGFIPRTYCGDQVAKLMKGAKKGDGDPLDICVISERAIAKSEVILNARVIGGIPMIDNGEADDKIIAVLDKDNIWSEVDHITHLPKVMVERLTHFFSTYKTVPNSPAKVKIGKAYNKSHALKVINAAIRDYKDRFGDG